MNTLRVISLSVAAFALLWVGDVSQTIAMESPDDIQQAPETINHIADIRLHSPQELNVILSRADKLLSDGEFVVGDSSPVVFLLHGEEARALFKSDYNEHKAMVDLAAKLSAFNVVDIRVCETWMRKNKLSSDQLQPFVKTVSYAPAEEKRLIKEEQYRYF